MTKPKYVPGVKGMLIEKPLEHRPSRLTFWTLWYPLDKKGRIGMFAKEYQGTPMLFFTKKDAQKHLGHPYSKGVPVKVRIRVSSKAE